MAAPITDRSTSSSTRDATGAQTIPALVRRSASVYTGTALRYWRGGRLRNLSYAELRTAVLEIARGLIALGVRPGDRVSILARVVELKSVRRCRAHEPEGDRSVGLQRAKHCEVLVRAGGIDHPAGTQPSEHKRRKRRAPPAGPGTPIHPVRRHIRDKRQLGARRGPIIPHDADSVAQSGHDDAEPELTG